MASVTAGILAELQAQAALHWRELLAHAGVWFGLHLLFEFALPALRPGCYDVYNTHTTLAGKKPLPRAALAKDLRTRAVAMIFALYVVSLALYGFWRGDYALLAAQPDFHASTPLTEHLCRVAAGFFIWDAAISVVDGYGAAFVFHGVACLCVFIAALGPCMHYMAFVALSFEASTIPLHLRRMMIMAGRTSGPQFAAVQYLFAATFFLFRIGLGWPAGLQWGAKAVAELRAPSPGTNGSIVLMYLVLCAGLSALNGWWMWEIVGVALKGSSKSRAQKGEPTNKALKEN